MYFKRKVKHAARLIGELLAMFIVFAGIFLPLLFRG